MQSTFTIVVFGAVGLSLVMSFIFLLGKGSVYDQIGEGGLSGESESPDGSARIDLARGAARGSGAGGGGAGLVGRGCRGTP